MATILRSGYPREEMIRYGAQLLAMRDEARTTAEIEAIDAEITRHTKALIFDSPARLAEAADPTWRSAPHLEMISDKITECLDRQVSCIIEVPVRHGKSELTSAHGPSWYLQRRPHHKVGMICHAATFAAEWGQRNRDLIESNPELFDVRIRRDSRRVDEWKTTAGGGMFCYGTGGSVTGRGFHLLLVDDPIKNAEQAFSEAFKTRFKHWWQFTTRTRLEAGASVIIIQARWCEDDLAGWLQEHASDNPLATQWEVISMPALAEPTVEEAKAPDYVPAEWVDEMGRHLGEALWSEQWPRDELLRAEADVGRLSFRALYQMRPVDVEGALFKEGAWKFVDAADVPKLVSVVRKWDLASTTDAGDWTVGALVGRDGRGYTWILDIIRFQKDAGETDNLLAMAAYRDGYDVPISLDQDPGSAGKRDAAYIAREVLPGYSVHFERPRGKAMARGLAGQQQLGNVGMVRAHWNGELIEEFRSFPNGKHDDQVDAVSAGFANCVEGIAQASSVGSSALL